MKRATIVNWMVSLTHHIRSAYMSLSSLLNQKALVNFSIENSIDFQIEGFVEESLPWSLAYFLWDSVDMPLSGAGYTHSNMIHHIGASLGTLIVMLTVSYEYNIYTITITRLTPILHAVQGKCQVFAFSAVLAEVNSVFLALRALFRHQSKTSLYRFAITPLLFSSFIFCRLYIHFLALVKSVQFTCRAKHTTNRALGVFGTVAGGGVFVNNLFILYSLLKSETRWRI